MTITTPAPCDSVAAALPRHQPGQGSAQGSTYVLAASILGSSLAFVDGSVVNVALPAIDAGLHSGGADISWAITAYLIPLGALSLLGGAIGDNLGRRRLFISGVVLFITASLVCAGAPTFSIFIIGRALQGVAAAALMPNSLALLGAAFEGDRRTSAIATWAAAGSLTGAIGPLLGGVIVDSVGWRMIFLLNVPLGAIAVWLAAAYLTETDDRSAAKDLDWSGSLTATAALALLTWSLTAAAKPQSDPLGIIAPFAVAVLLGGLFVAIERAKGPHALVPSSIFATSAFVGLTLLTLFLYAALGGLTVLLPFFLIRYAQYSASAAGAALLPIPIIIGFGSRFVGHFSNRIGSRNLLVSGSITVSAGLLMYSSTSNTVDYWLDIFPATLLVAIGMALTVAPLTTAVMDSVDSTHIGAASGLNSATARVGGLIASALLAFVFVQQSSDEQLMQGFRIAAVIGALICAAAAASALFLIRRSSLDTKT